MNKMFDFETKEDGSFAFYFKPPEILDKETRQHFLSSQKEFFMGIRSMLDYMIENIDKKEDKGSTKIEVM